MFYCTECRIRNDWPVSVFKSLGICEVCGKRDLCNDVKSSDLSDPNEINIVFPLSLVDMEIFDTKGRLLAKCYREDVAKLLLARLNSSGVVEEI